MTDAEIVTFLSQSTGKSCGRFRREQLNRPLVEQADIWRTRWLALVTLLGFGVAVTSPAQAQQLPEPAILPQAVTVGMVATRPTAPPPSVSEPLLTIRGVVAETGSQQPLPGVTVLVKGTPIGTSSASDGTFELQVPAGQSTVLLVSSIGYETQELTLRPTAHQSMVSVMLTMQPDVKGEFIGTALPWYTPRSLWWRLTRPFRR
ncbi:carboxypeptidase-like regulatory domain-containing protein [Hymenobacter sediminis]|uniref:carboxypeptidase-like regulatory domain-containing protein n=1 Tax=Hymenobacter sediminis TaxID=2218621 RepID=UPI001390091D|nr:carboxypeptidase-like regulatory domain-containing protein [Hymenobacter sediminis]